MLRHLLTICLFFLPPVLAAQAGSGAQLQSLLKNESMDEMVVNLIFSTPAAARLEVSGQRIDLFLADTTASPALGTLPQDGSILRVLLAQRGPELMVSLLLSRPARGVRLDSPGDARDLALHVDWDEGTRGIRPAIAGNLRGRTRADDQGRHARVAATSRYANRWRDFYRGHATPVNWEMKPRYTMPELPAPDPGQIVAGTPAAWFREAWRLGLADRWEESAALLKRVAVAELAVSDRQPFFLLHGAALLQSGADEQAAELYRQFVEASPDATGLNRFRLLQARRRAQDGDPYGAASAIATLIGGGRNGEEPWLGWAELLLAEIRLATGRPGAAREGLERLAGSGGSRLARAVQLRLADVNSVQGRRAEALKGYREWLRQGEMSRLDVYSLSQLALCLEAAGEWGEAERVYVRLADLAGQPAGIALALHAAARTAAQRDEIAKALSRCAAVRREYAGTEGAFRAWLLELDLIMSGQDKAAIMGRGDEYAAIAQDAPSRDLREEAAFKHALTVLLAGRTGPGLEILQGFRRDFASGVLLGEADALTLEFLESLVMELLREGRGVEALALVEQNRDLLATRALPPHFAVAVAGAFRDLGLLERAASVYGYLLEDARGKAEAEPYYLPLVEALEAAGRYQELIGRVRLYRERFPAGPALTSLLLAEGRALLALGRLDEAIALLPTIQGQTPEVLALRNRLVLALAAGEADNSSAMQGLLAARMPQQRAGIQLLQAERDRKSVV